MRRSRRQRSYFIHWSLNGRSLAYTIAVSIGTGIVFGVVPAFQATGTSLQESLREGGRGATGERRAWVAIRSQSPR